MIALTAGFAWFVLMLGLYAYCLARRWWMVAALAVLLVAAYLAAAEVMGRAKPIELEWRSFRPKVIAYVLDEPRAIYVWLDLSPPRSYRLPWSIENAQELQDGMKTEGGVSMELKPFDLGPERRDPVIHRDPQQANPPKR